MTSVRAGQKIELAEIDSAADLVVALTGESAESCLAGVLEACSRPLIYSRHHWLEYKGEYRVRADLRQAFEAAKDRSPDSWDADEADLVLTLFALDLSEIGLDELDDRVDFTAVREVLISRHTLYGGVVDPAEKPPHALLDLAMRVAQLRSLAQESHELYSVIDGRAWHCAEGLIPRHELASDVLAPSVLETLAGRLVVPADGTAFEQIRAMTTAAVEADGDSAAVVRGLMRAALADPVLRADHVTVTCPMGDLLDTPQEMTTSSAFFTETQLRDGLDLGDFVERLGHESQDQLQRTIKARMLKLKRGAIRSLYGPGCLHGRFVGKHGGHMIFRNEDAHYRGHKSIGCSSGGRAAFTMRYETDGVSRSLTSMIGDFRVVRMSHDERDTFQAEDLRHVIKYGEWIRTVVEQTFLLGAVIRQEGH